MHSAIIGKTESGKTTLAKKLAAGLRARGYGILVLDPFLDNFDCDFITDDTEKFLSVCRGSWNCQIFVDEAGMTCGNYAQNMHWLATAARHNFHNVFFIAQRYKMLAVNIRGNLGRVFLFSVPKSICRDIYVDYDDEQVLNAHNLQQGEYLVLQNFRPTQRRKLFIPRK